MLGHMKITHAVNRLMCRMAWLLLGVTGCGRREPGTFQGYIEGDFVYVGMPVGGRLDKRTCNPPPPLSC